MSSSDLDDLIGPPFYRASVAALVAVGGRNASLAVAGRVPSGAAEVLACSAAHPGHEGDIVARCLDGSLAADATMCRGRSCEGLAVEVSLLGRAGVKGQFS